MQSNAMMNKKSFTLLEKVFESEIDAALRETKRLYQPRGKAQKKIAEELVESGHLAVESFVLGGRLPVTITGYVLTDFGHMEYCTNC